MSGSKLIFNIFTNTSQHDGCVNNGFETFEVPLLKLEVKEIIRTQFNDEKIINETTK